MLKAKILIECCILLEKALNIKIDEVVHWNVALLFVIILLDFKLVCKFCECLSEE